MRTHSQPAHELWALTCKAKNLAALSLRSTFYERHEILDSEGQVLEKDTRGIPWVWRKDLGQIPVDPAAPFLDDGRSVRQDTVGYSDGDGRWHRVTQYRLLAGEMPAPRRAAPRSDLLKEKRSACAEILGFDQEDPVSVSIRLVDKTELRSLPSRTITGLAFKEFHRTDHLSRLRGRWRAENTLKRRIWAAPVRAWLRSVGAKIESHTTVYANIVQAMVPRRRLLDLAGREDVAHIEARARQGVPDEDLSSTYLCSGTPLRDLPVREPWLYSNDTSVCRRSRVHAFLDGVNAAMGVLQYVNAGYSGLTPGGLAPWAILPGMPYFDWHTLSIAVMDNGMDPLHPAFSLGSVSRFSYFLTKSGAVHVYSDLNSVDPDLFDDGHGTTCSAIAISSVWDGQDVSLVTDEERAARSGVARGVVAVGSAMVHPVDILEALAGDFAGTPNGEAVRDVSEDSDGSGVDVITHSTSRDAGYHIRNCHNYCPTSEQARGIDDESRAIVRAFVNDGFLYVKSAGDMGDCPSTYRDPTTHVLTRCYQVGAPGASPAVLAVGAMDNQWETPDEMQESVHIYSGSSGDILPDGRTYPSLVVASYQCGCATSDAATPSSWLFDNAVSYGANGATSAATPRIAGAALLFKHWYLEQYGSVGNDPGRIMVNMLNFADGYAEVDNTLSGVRAAPPSPWWGLGRFRLRLISQDGLGGQGYWGTSTFCLRTGETQVIDLAEEADGGVLPEGTRRLRITAWWLEVNTGKDESKANVSMTLLSPDDDAFSSARTVETSTDHALRLQVDRNDSYFPCPPKGGGFAYLLIEGVNIPPDASPANGTDYRDYRTVYVSWIWETGSDPSLIACTGDRPEVRHCEPLESRVSRASGELPVRRMRASLDSSIRKQILISTGAASGGGTTPVGTSRRTR